MGKLKGPCFTNDMEFEKWKKLLRNWVITIPNNATNEEIVAAVIVGLSDSRSKSGVIDLVLDLDEDHLYADTDPVKVTFPETEEKVDTSKPVSKRSIHGLELIIKTLEQKYGLNEEERIFKYYEDFENLKRGDTMTMNDYLVKFESAYKKLESKGIQLNDVVLAYRLLKNASLGNDEKLARTSVSTMDFENMKKTLMKMSDGVICTSSSKTVVPPKFQRVKVKEEPQDVLYQEEEDQNACYSSQGAGGSCYNFNEYQ